MSVRRFATFLLATIHVAASAAADAEQAMPGMAMPGSPHPQDGEEATRSQAPMHGMHMNVSPANTGVTAADARVGDAPPPPMPTDHYADRQFPADEMADARAAMMREQGGQAFHQILFNLAELQVRRGREGYRWNGEGWFGGDLDRLVVKSEGEGSFGRRIDTAEVQALYSRAIGPYFDLQAGLRHDFAPIPTRTYATLGVQGLAPYAFEVEGSAYVAFTGQVLARLEGWQDERLTQRLVLQPRMELNMAAQDDPATRTGAGLIDAELGLRLRYEFARELAPYVGISYEAETGRTADYARANGERPRTTSFVGGVRVWF